MYIQYKLGFYLIFWVGWLGISFPDCDRMFLAKILPECIGAAISTVTVFEGRRGPAKKAKKEKKKKKKKKKKKRKGRKKVMGGSISSKLDGGNSSQQARGRRSRLDEQTRRCQLGFPTDRRRMMTMRMLPGGRARALTDRLGVLRLFRDDKKLTGKWGWWEKNG